jgi:hypothetical protein
MPDWSREVRVLLRPAATFRALADEPTGGAWTLLRRPLLLAIVFGCLVSLEASGRLSARLLTDGIVSFAFVPIFEVLSVMLVYRRAPRRLSLAQAVDLFFVANAPWLFFVFAVLAIRCLQTPVQATAMPEGWEWTLLLSLCPLAAWSLYIDIQFFRSISAQPDRGIAGDLTLQRVISWTCILGWYVGHEVWQLIAAWINV